MSHPAGAGQRDDLRLDFDRRVRSLPRRTTGLGLGHFDRIQRLLSGSCAAAPLRISEFGDLMDAGFAAQAKGRNVR